jgi:hypothetical protein
MIIAKRLPFLSVINRIYFKLLDQWMIHNSIGTSNDEMKMMVAIHREIPPNLSYDAMAASMLMLLVSTLKVPLGEKPLHSENRDRQIQKLRHCVRALDALLGSLFDGTLLLEALLSFQVSTTWSHRDDEDKARLMLQCMTLSASSIVNDTNPSDIDVQSLRSTLRRTRKLMLTWCCTEYGPHFRVNGPMKRLNYFQNGFGKQGSDEFIPSWLRIMRCLLFVEPPDSLHMKHFFLKNHDTVDDISDWEQELMRVKACCRYGGDLHNDLIWIVLKSASMSNGIDAGMAIQILEHLLEKCSQSSHTELIVNDPKIVWELYNLVMYEPESLHVKANYDRKDETKGDQLDPNDLPRYVNFFCTFILYIYIIF